MNKKSLKKKLMFGVIWICWLFPVTLAQAYTVVDTGQTKCYDNHIEIDAPSAGEVFYGQDAQHDGSQPSYTLSNDGLTVYDNHTRLTWQKSPDMDGDGDIDADDKLSYSEAMAYADHLNTLSFGGYTDWRLPTIKELYSLIGFNGTDPSGAIGNDTSSLTPYINTMYFDFAYGDTDAGERLIDAQYASSTIYVSNTGGDGGDTMFGVNFADGRIKGYGLSLFGFDKTFYVICVRADTEYGKNRLMDNGDGTVTDQATGLMWTQNDSGQGLNWQAALAWAQSQNSANYLGYNDWRLPDAKELQSIVDYARAPDTTGSAAIDPLFACTSIINEAGETDYPYYWTSTTHAAANGMGASAVYIAFGRALGFMFGEWVDVHGAGAQRSDPKSGDPSFYPTGRGPQGDAVRIYNYVRLVRDALSSSLAPSAVDDAYFMGKKLMLTVDVYNGVLSNDISPEDDALTAVLVEDVGHGSLVLNDDGSFSYTPKVGFFGVDSFSYYASDGANDSETATVTINRRRPRPPIFRR
jgi:hypothetical protein